MFNPEPIDVPRRAKQKPSTEINGVNGTDAENKDSHGVKRKREVTELEIRTGPEGKNISKRLKKSDDDVIVLDEEADDGIIEID